MNFKPMRDLILIEPDDVLEVTSGGIHIPNAFAERPLTGTIIAVGPGKKTEYGLIPLSVKSGDRVAYTKMVGTEIKLEDKNYILASQDEIVGIIT